MARSERRALVSPGPIRSTRGRREGRRAPRGGVVQTPTAPLVSRRVWTCSGLGEPALGGCRGDDVLVARVSGRPRAVWVWMVLPARVVETPGGGDGADAGGDARPRHRRRRLVPVALAVARVASEGTKGGGRGAERSRVDGTRRARRSRGGRFDPSAELRGAARARARQASAEDSRRRPGRGVGGGEVETRGTEVGRARHPGSRPGRGEDDDRDSRGETRITTSVSDGGEVGGEASPRHVTARAAAPVVGACIASDGGVPDLIVIRRVSGLCAAAVKAGGVDAGLAAVRLSPALLLPRRLRPTVPRDMPNPSRSKGRGADAKPSRAKPGKDLEDAAAAAAKGWRDPSPYPFALAKATPSLGSENLVCATGSASVGVFSLATGVMVYDCELPGIPGSEHVAVMRTMENPNPAIGGERSVVRTLLAVATAGSSAGAGGRFEPRARRGRRANREGRRHATRRRQNAPSARRRRRPRPTRRGRRRIGDVRVERRTVGDEWRALSRDRRDARTSRRPARGIERVGFHSRRVDASSAQSHREPTDACPSRWYARPLYGVSSDPFASVSPRSAGAHLATASGDPYQIFPAPGSCATPSMTTRVAPSNSAVCTGVTPSPSTSADPQLAR